MFVWCPNYYTSSFINTCDVREHYFLACSRGTTSDLVAVLQEHGTCICATTVPRLLTWVSDGPLFDKDYGCVPGRENRRSRKVVL